MIEGMKNPGENFLHAVCGRHRPTRLLASNNFIIFINHIFMFLIVIGHQSIHNRMRPGFVSQVPIVYYDILLWIKSFWLVLHDRPLALAAMVRRHTHWYHCLVLRVLWTGVCHGQEPISIRLRGVCRWVCACIEIEHVHVHKQLRSIITLQQRGEAKF